MAEHFNRVLSESITTMLSESHFPLQFWRKSLTAFVYAHNRYSTFALPSITPFEVWKGHKPDPAYLKLWKYTACVYMQKHKRTSSLGSHMEKYVFFGYSANYTAILNLDGRCLIVRLWLPCDAPVQKETESSSLRSGGPASCFTSGEHLFSAINLPTLVCIRNCLSSLKTM